LQTLTDVHSSAEETEAANLLGSPLKFLPDLIPTGNSSSLTLQQDSFLTPSKTCQKSVETSKIQTETSSTSQKGKHKQKKGIRKNLHRRQGKRKTPPTEPENPPSRKVRAKVNTVLSNQKRHVAEAFVEYMKETISLLAWENNNSDESITLGAKFLSVYVSFKLISDGSTLENALVFAADLCLVHKETVRWIEAMTEFKGASS